MQKLKTLFTTLTVISTIFVLNTLVGCPINSENKPSNPKESKISKINNDFKNNPTYSFDVTGDDKISAITIKALNDIFTLETTDDSPIMFVFDTTTPEWFTTIINYLNDEKILKFQDFDPTGLKTKITNELKDYSYISEFLCAMLTEIYDFYHTKFEGLFTEEETLALLIANIVLQNLGKDIDLTSDITNFQIVLTIEGKKYNITLEPSTVDSNYVGLFKAKQQQGIFFPLWVDNLLPVINNIFDDAKVETKLQALDKYLKEVYTFILDLVVVSRDIVNPLSNQETEILNTIEGAIQKYAAIINMAEIKYENNKLNITHPLLSMLGGNISYDVVIDKAKPEITLTPTNIPSGFEWTTNMINLYANVYLSSLSSSSTEQIVALKKLNYIYTYYPNTKPLVQKIISELFQ